VKSAFPKFQEYATAGGKEVLKTLQLAADLVPVPLLRNVLGVAIKVIEVCEVSITMVKEYRANHSYYPIIDLGSYSR